MPRQARLLLPHSYYHVMARGNNKNIIFRTNEDYYYFLDLIVKYKLEHPFDLYHYCLLAFGEIIAASFPRQAVGYSPLL